MKNSSFYLILLLLLSGLSFSKELAPTEDRSKVEFFEKIYNQKIEGVKLFHDYPDPDSFYSDIAKRVGIPEIVYKAVEEKYGWKNDEKNFLALMIKGGGRSDDWGVMVTKFPSGLKNAKSKEETKKLLKDMEMKMVVVGYDGKVSFPEFKDE